jgi:hypothetical protein
MIFSAFQKEDADNVFSIVRNVSGSTISAGAAVVWDVSTQVDGVRVTTPATATLGILAGITDESMANSAYGRVQKHGYKSQAYVLPDGSVTMTAGSLIVASNGQTYLAYNTQNTAATIKSAGVGLVFAAEDVAAATTTVAVLKKVLIRAL